VKVHAELDALMVDTLRIIGCVHICGLLRTHPLVVVIKDGLDNSVTDCFGDNLLSFFDALERELGGDVLEGDLGVADVDLLETKLDDGVAKALDQGKVLVSLEERLVLDQQRLESIHVTMLHTRHDLVVGKQGLLEIGIGEDLTVGDVSHKQLHNDLELGYLDAEGLGSDLWTLS
jgi:hypothetical protein